MRENFLTMVGVLDFECGKHDSRSVEALLEGGPSGAGIVVMTVRAG